MIRLWFILSALGLVLAAPRNSNQTAYTINLISSNGYAAESHDVVTEDGYILTMFRIPYGRGLTSAAEDRPVVFLMHGLYGSSNGFIGMGPQYSIAYNLADAGFDVWMGNARGNSYARSHLFLNPDDPVQKLQFFDFSWEEIGTLDLPAMFDYVLNHTNNQKLHYIGHSQGGTVMLVMAPMRPEYQEKLASIHLLAGVGYMDYFPDEELKSVAVLTDLIYAVALAEGVVEINANNINDILPPGYTRADLCFGDIKYKPMCDLIGARHFIRDTSSDEVNVGVGGGSLKQIAHYGQNIRDTQFRRFHYGTGENQDIYGTAEPPIYDLSLITAYVTMHYSVSDHLLDERDVLAMAADMPNTIVRKVARETFGHNDFLVATDAKELVTDYVIEAINRVHIGGPAFPDTDGGSDGESDGGSDGGWESESENGSQDGDSDNTVTVAPEPVPGAASNIVLNFICKTLIILSAIFVTI